MSQQVEVYRALNFHKLGSPDVSTSIVCGSDNIIFSLGTSSDNSSYTAGSPIFKMYATSSNTTSTNSEPFYVYSVMTGAGGYGGRSRFHSYTNVALGSNFMALKAYTEYGSSGSCAGLSAGLCAELKTPNASISGGAYYVLELEYVAGGTSTTTNPQGTQAGFIYFGNSGDSDGDFDDNGYFWYLAGLTAGANHLLSLTSETLRVNVAGTARYLVLSQSQDGLGLGNSTTAQSYTAGTPPMNFYFTSSNTTSTNSEPFYLKSTMTGTNGYGGRSRFHAYTNVTLGSNFQALKAYLEFGTSGRCSGLSAALCAEVSVPNAALTAGNYYVAELEYVAGGTSTVTNPQGCQAGFIYMAQSGDTDGDFDDNGYLFRLDGCTVGSGHLFQTNTAADATHALRINIGGTNYYIMLTSSGA